MKIVNYTNKSRWNQIVKSFSNWDVYYLNEYAVSFMLHGDGVPYLIYYSDESCRICQVIMKNDIGKSKFFSNCLAQNKYFDISTPYGYGGPLSDGVVTEKSKVNFTKKLNDFAKKNKIVTQFVRFHPLYQNHLDYENVFEIQVVKDTIFVDTTKLDEINSNLDSKNRNMIKKAIKNGVKVTIDYGSKIAEFIDIYESTMDENHARKYYYFEKSYYEYIISNMSENTIFFYASNENGEIISAAIFFFNDKYMHYHLSGTKKEYRSFASMNLILYEAALWANKNGIIQLHLGGGLNTDDGLFRFKYKFNGKGKLPFAIGRNIFSKKTYDYLLKKRFELDSNFDKNNGNLIQYRKELT